MAEQLIQLTFQPCGRRINVRNGINILVAARESGIDINASCGGAGTCGKCRILVLSGETSPPTPKELTQFSEDDLNNGNRFACQACAYSDLVIEIPISSRGQGQRLQTEINPLAGDKGTPPLDIFELEITPPKITDLRSDFTRLADALKKPALYAAPEVMQSLSCDLRHHNWHTQVVLSGDEVVNINVPGTQSVGFAVDLGTTKIASCLLDLRTGDILAAKGIPNPLIPYGDDIISRMNYACQASEGRQILAQKLQNGLDSLLGDLVSTTGLQRSQVLDACIVGNTAMIHLFHNLPLEQLLKAPYVAAYSDTLRTPAGYLGLEMAPGARVHIPGCIGGYVGADHVAMILGSQIDQSEKVTLGVDIGTNTEIVLRMADGRMASVSCASGPAFEGAHVSEGMRAASGAIEKVKIDENMIICETIDHQAPIGLCGSGIIDVIAEMYRNDMLNSRGRIQSGENIISDELQKSLRLVPAEQSGTGRDILVSQEDINQIQLAKGAIRAGLDLLMLECQVASEDVEEVIIAGAFGSYLSIQNAIGMGLFPDLPNAAYHQVGNAAALGAVQILLAQEARHRGENIQQETQYFELTTSPKFNRTFALGMLFPEKKEEK